MSNLSTSAFKVLKSFLAAKSDVSMPVTYSNTTLTLHECLVLDNSLFIIYSATILFNKKLPIIFYRLYL